MCIYLHQKFFYNDFLMNVNKIRKNISKLIHDKIFKRTSKYIYYFKKFVTIIFNSIFLLKNWKLRMKSRHFL